MFAAVRRKRKAAFDPAAMWPGEDQALYSRDKDRIEADDGVRRRLAEV
jgi:hypothetical protein